MAALSFPLPTQVGDTYIGTNNIKYVWEGDRWTSIGSLTTAPVVTASASAPTVALPGSLWYDTVAAILKVRHNDQWIDVRPN